MTIINANEQHIPAIIHLAAVTWNDTYSSIISQEQIQYMLQLFYSKDVLLQQMHSRDHHFWILLDDKEISAYAHCIEDACDPNMLKLSKLYVLPKFQGSGAGRLLLMHIENECYSLKRNRIVLNVNRNNPAKTFYLKRGFEIVQEVDIPLGKFWLNDYVMEKKLE